MRFLVGLIKGILLGGALGYGLAAAGLTVLPGWVAYVAAVLVGIAVALVAGKPIWAEDARIEVGAKAVAGAVVAPGLMALVRHVLDMGLPVAPSQLPGVTAVDGVTLGTFAVSSLAIVAAVLAGFFDADNDGKNVAALPPAKGETEANMEGSGKRFDLEKVLGGVDLDALEEAPPPSGRTRDQSASS